MKEFITKTLVLGYRNFSNEDRQADLFTKDLGRLKARVVSGSKPTSKLSPHLDILNLSTVRLIRKNRFTVADSLTEERFDNIRSNVVLASQAINLTSLIKSTFPELVPDMELWHTLKASLKKGFIDEDEFMKILGYNPELADCVRCGDGSISHFLTSDQSFVCEECSSNIPNKLLVRRHG